MTGIVTLLSLTILNSIFSIFGGAKKTDPDAAVLAQLKKAGSDLSKPHQIEFFLYFQTESLAQQAALEIREKRFSVEVKRAAQGDNWLCFATKAIVPDLTALQDIRRQFNELAASKGGEYDGWGTAVVK
jgi:regulator of RNase E activity RraB